MSFHFMFVDEQAKAGDEAARALLTPKRGTAAASGFDLVAANFEPIAIAPGERKLIATGISISIPFGFEAQIRPRSGLALKNGLTCLNTPGTIDSDYRGEIKVILINLGQETFTVERGMRIAQLVIAPVSMLPMTVVDELTNTDRGEAGFGSTGVA